MISKNLLKLGFLAFIVFFIGSAVAEASYYTDYSGYSPFSRDDRGSYVAFPRGSGSFYGQHNRDSLSDYQSTYGNYFSDRDNSLNERGYANSFGANLNFGRNILDSRDFKSYSQTGSNSNNGYVNYVEGDGNMPTYKRTLQGDFKGKRNDFAITETIYGGPRINYNNNFNNDNRYNNLEGYDVRGYTDTFNSGASSNYNSLNRDLSNKERETNTLTSSNKYSRTSFGQGFNIAFN